MRLGLWGYQIAFSVAKQLERESGIRDKVAWRMLVISDYGWYRFRIKTTTPRKKPKPKMATTVTVSAKCETRRQAPMFNNRHLFAPFDPVSTNLTMLEWMRREALRVRNSAHASTVSKSPKRTRRSA